MQGEYYHLSSFCSQKNEATETNMLKVTKLMEMSGFKPMQAFLQEEATTSNSLYAISQKNIHNKEKPHLRAGTISMYE